MSVEGFEPVIGLEVHAQLQTHSKMFCPCSAAYSDAPPNTFVCAVCGGMPGALPVINRKAVVYTVMVALALHCTIAKHSKFDRKNYSYPDLPKGYQISQYDLPLAQDGWVEYDIQGHTFRCGITRVHLEEDTGKSTHTRIDGRDVSLVDYNRSGVPLLEIVSRPDIRAPEEARQFFATLRQILMYLGVNDGNLQEGSLRADVNVSLRRPGDSLPTSKVEIKNLNSFRSVRSSLEYEIERQRRLLDMGELIPQETRGWSEAREVTVGQRSKEFADDYRYFPEPDLPPLVLDRRHIDYLASHLPELPQSRTRRFVEGYGLSQAQATVLTEDKELADFYEATVVAATPAPPVMVANWISGDTLGLLNDRKLSLAQSTLRPDRVGKLMLALRDETISSAAGKRVLEEMLVAGEDPEYIIDHLNLRQVRDESELGRWVVDVLSSNPDLVLSYRAGRTNVLQHFVGQVMKRSAGKADPVRARQLLERRLSELD
ncbi:MAG: Asp-tRNA(Asn)/Glu-tRNA(Gln) amidotransferase subunit GatB [Chloroflexota bacterium]|nr:MAG: Asp-tRNA(Asn)/Glu-tRNA(Gln) amidotransferase GatCAB subunit B [Chloroflexota bacterium]